MNTNPEILNLHDPVPNPQPLRLNSHYPSPNLMPGKISRLPRDIRLQLNQRLSNGELGDTLLPWLDALPEVQSVLTAHFAGQPISEQNLSDYRKFGFRRWQLRETALEFASDEAADASAADPNPVSPLVDHLVHWIATRFAAAAQTAPISEDPGSDLRDIRSFLADIVSLRRGDLVARRLALEQQRLALDQASAEPELEKRIWEWTKRPDIQAKLYPHRDPEQTRLDAMRLIDEHLLGLRSSTAFPEPVPDPACLI